MRTSNWRRCRRPHEHREGGQVPLTWRRQAAELRAGPRMALVGSVRPQQVRSRPQALRQPACGGSEDGDPDGARRLHAPAGRHQCLGGPLRQHRRQRPRRQGDELRSDGRQGVPPPDLLQIATFRGPHVMQGSIAIKADPSVQYLLRIGDTALVHAQRLAEWTGHAPQLEEDIALANMALDLLGQARAVLTHAGAIEGEGHDEDQLAFLREERDYRNVTLVELPRGDFAVTIVRNTMMATFFKLLWGKLVDSSDAELAAIAGKAVKETRYHQQHAADWLVRLAGGTDESRRRVDKALAQLWPYHAELFASDAVDAYAEQSGLGPRWSALKDAWFAEMGEIFGAAGLTLPAASTFLSTGKTGVHSEHMGLILAEMQHLQRAYPGGVW